MSQSMRDKIRAKQGMIAEKAAQISQPPQTTHTPKQPKKKGEPMSKRKDRRQSGRGRLPDGAVYAASYTAETMLWRASLAIPGFAAFEGEGPGVFQLLESLDTRYRIAAGVWKEKKKPPLAVQAAPG